ncbi:PiggyBac transposable element-derived protein 4 [Cucumispora dikerogammari]|nr:PiggyBac transposable element-derived protein 4 [Cucumispora dikerogammari]
MDNYYNSFELCENLRQDKIFCCGTMRMRRGKLSEYSTQKKRMSKNDFNYFQKHNINCALWYDKKPVCFISTFMNFESELTEGRKVFNKSLIIKDYDANMGGVDKYDQMLKTYFNERKSVRCTNTVNLGYFGNV